MHMDFSCNRDLYEMSVLTGQKTVKTLCDKRVSMNQVTWDEKKVTCEHCQKRIVEREEGIKMIQEYAEKLKNG